MNEKKAAILAELNDNPGLTEHLSDGDTLTVLDETLTYSEQSSWHDSEVTGNLDSPTLSFTRTGEKELSYDSWVGTTWPSGWAD